MSSKVPGGQSLLSGLAVKLRGGTHTTLGHHLSGEFSVGARLVAASA